MYAIGVTIVIAIVYYILDRLPWMNNLGRKKRNLQDSQMENVIGTLSKLAIKHETDESGTDWYQVQTKAVEEEESE